MMKKKILDNIEIINECWIWKGSKNIKGYGNLRDGKKTKLAHRASYEVFKGNIMHELCVLHTCDNRSCVNPDHLWQGTHEDNAKDRQKKDRSADRKGEKHGRSKLDENQVGEILKMLEKGMTQREIAKKYDVDQSTIYKINVRKNWSHLNKGSKR
jgi:hypothetical protein